MATALGAATALANVVKGPADGFGLLRAVLEAIPGVRLRPPAQNPSLTNTLQETVVIGNRIENLLSRIAALEAVFAMRPGDVEEQSRRNELIRYAFAYPLDSALSSFQ